MTRIAIFIAAFIVPPLALSGQADRTGLPEHTQTVADACGDIARREIKKAAGKLDKSPGREAERRMATAKARLLANDSVESMLRCVMLRQARR
ncbi:MAG: hypothetical protein H6955_18720 [Chromatiaceae bacterium]|nr:hypothetical protein [Gammaproteobacteria bacterium]MCP5315600.1 hypothetical protein [Chromatiaceae bacterium]